MPGFFALTLAIIASGSSCSPCPVHHEDTSPWSFSGAGSGSFTTLADSLAGSLDLEQAEIEISTAARLSAKLLIECRRIGILLEGWCGAHATMRRLPRSVNRRWTSQLRAGREYGTSQR